MRPEGLDGGPAHRCDIQGGGGSLCQPGEHRDLRVPAVDRRGRELRRIRALPEKALDITLAKPPIAARVDAVGGQPPRLGPGADGVGMDAEQGGGLGDADQLFTSAPTIAMPVGHQMRSPQHGARQEAAPTMDGTFGRCRAADGRSGNRADSIPHSYRAAPYLSSGRVARPPPRGAPAWRGTAGSAAAAQTAGSSFSVGGGQCASRPPIAAPSAATSRPAPRNDATSAGPIRSRRGPPSSRIASSTSRLEIT